MEIYEAKELIEEQMNARDRALKPKLTKNEIGEKIKEIGNQISQLDEKIEANRNKMKKLEALADEFRKELWSTIVGQNHLIARRNSVEKFL
jgi:flagellar biosynthesis chaperone FliJ